MAPNEAAGGGKGAPKTKLKLWLRGLPASMTEETAREVQATQPAPLEPPASSLSKAWWRGWECSPSGCEALTRGVVGGG